MKTTKIFRIGIALMVVGWTFNTLKLVGKNASQSESSALAASLQQGAPKDDIGGEHPTLVDWRDFRAVNKAGETVGPPRFLLGIMTYDGLRREFDRREMLRQTYLSYYRDHGAETETNRICPLYQLVEGSVTWEDCQIAYTFVLGQSKPPFPAGNRTELLNAPTTHDMLRHHVALPDPDILPFDIVENGKFGKSPTWFRYANLLVQEQNWTQSVNYIIKTDSDTLIIPIRFLRWISEMEVQVQYQRERIYGGVPLDKKGCGWPSHDHCAMMKAPYFNGGGLYLASLDVSQYIVSDNCPRKSLFLPHEDVTMGNYVHSMEAFTGLPIQNFSNPDAYQNTWKHPVKDPKRINSLWKTYLRKKKQRMKANKKNRTLGAA